MTQSLLPAQEDPYAIATSLISIELDELDDIATARPRIRIVAPLVPNYRPVVRPQHRAKYTWC